MTGYDYSVIVAFYNEAETIERFYRELADVFQTLPGRVEYWFVDDGSDDETFSVLKQLVIAEKNLNVLKLSRNFGQHAALFAGLPHAQGRLSVLMSGDCQDRPGHIPLLLEKLHQGYDVVITTRRKRQGPFFRAMAATLFWNGLNYCSARPIYRDQAILRIFTERVKTAILQCSGPQQFLGGIFSYVGFRQIAVAVDQGPRFKGSSKYSWSKLIDQFFAAFLGYTENPLRILIYFGLTLTGISFLIFTIMVLCVLLRNTDFSAGWTNVLLLFGFGVQCAIGGVIAEYLGRMYRNTLNRPPYVIEEILVSTNSDDETTRL